jgi:hypothetical protein
MLLTPLQWSRGIVVDAPVPRDPIAAGLDEISLRCGGIDQGGRTANRGRHGSVANMPRKQA